MKKISQIKSFVYMNPENKKKKILISLFRFPYPATDGTRYKILDNVIEGLLKDFDLEFFVATTEKIKPADFDFFEKKYGKVHLFTGSKFLFMQNAFSAIFSKFPIQSKVFIFKEARGWLAKNIAKYDAHYVHEIRMTEYFINFSEQVRKKIFVDLNDAISLHYKSGLEKFNFFKKIVYKLEYLRLAKYERLVLERFPYFTVVSEHDRGYLLGLAPERAPEIEFKCIHHGIVEQSNKKYNPAGNKLFFLGNLHYYPNKDALTFFFEEVWGKLKAQIPDIELSVIGKGWNDNPYKELPGVSFSGFVPDLWSEIQDCAVLVAPIRFGGGTPSKILEIMSFGFPVVTTPGAVKGVPGLKNNENILIVPESGDEWMASIKNILSDTNNARLIGDTAKEFISNNYSSTNSQKEYRGVFHAILHN